MVLTATKAMVRRLEESKLLMLDNVDRCHQPNLALSQQNFGEVLQRDEALKLDIELVVDDSSSDVLDELHVANAVDMALWRRKRNVSDDKLQV